MCQLPVAEVASGYVILWHLELLEDTAVRLLVLPEGAKEAWPESPTRSATFERFAEQYRSGAALRRLADDSAGQAGPGRGHSSPWGSPGVRRPPRARTRARQPTCTQISLLDQGVGEGNLDDDDTDDDGSPGRGGAKPLRPRNPRPSCCVSWTSERGVSWTSG